MSFAKVRSVTEAWSYNATQTQITVPASTQLGDFMWLQVCRGAQSTQSFTGSMTISGGSSSWSFRGNYTGPDGSTKLLLYTHSKTAQAQDLGGGVVITVTGVPATLVMQTLTLTVIYGADFRAITSTFNGTTTTGTNLNHFAPTSQAAGDLYLAMGATRRLSQTSGVQSITPPTGFTYLSQGYATPSPQNGYTVEPFSSYVDRPVGQADYGTVVTKTTPTMGSYASYSVALGQSVRNGKPITAWAKFAGSGFKPKNHYGKPVTAWAKVVATGKKDRDHLGRVTAWARLAASGQKTAVRAGKPLVAWAFFRGAAMPSGNGQGRTLPAVAYLSNIHGQHVTPAGRRGDTTVVAYFHDAHGQHSTARRGTINAWAFLAATGEKPPTPKYDGTGRLGAVAYFQGRGQSVPIHSVSGNGRRIRAHAYFHHAAGEKWEPTPDYSGSATLAAAVAFTDVHGKRKPVFTHPGKPLVVMAYLAGSGAKVHSQPETGDGAAVNRTFARILARGIATRLGAVQTPVETYKQGNGTEGDVVALIGNGEDQQIVATMEAIGYPEDTDSGTGTISGDDEIGPYYEADLLYSAHGYTEKGVTLAAGQGRLNAGVCIAQSTVDKLHYRYLGSQAEDLTYPIGILRSSVIVPTTRNTDANILVCGTVNLDALSEDDINALVTHRNAHISVGKGILRF